MERGTPTKLQLHNVMLKRLGYQTSILKNIQITPNVQFTGCFVGVQERSTEVKRRKRKKGQVKKVKENLKNLRHVETLGLVRTTTCIMLSG
jgi:hypothetical protein